jgi:hypothetical protein
MWPCSILDNVARLMPLSSANSCWLHANASLCPLIQLANASARATISGSRVPDLPPPPSLPQELLDETERLISELEGYVRRINRTNLSATLADGETTLTDALARRDAMTLRYGLLKTLVSTASDRLPRYGRAEIRILPAVEVGPLRRRMDELARQRRELDTAIQEANWAIDLMED